MKKIILSSMIASTLLLSHISFAEVSSDEAATLKTTLNPFGGERAGNAEGTIPAWDGGLTSSDSATVGDVPTDLFLGEKPVMQITSKNMSEHAEKLTPGTQELLKKYSGTLRVDVYPTHRTSAAAQYVYDNTLKNATNCKIADGGKTVTGCFGGIPFPIPKSGSEVIWNNLLRVEAEATEFGFSNQVVSSDGQRTLATRNDNYYQYPYYYKDGSVADWNGNYFIQRFNTTAPAFKVGESLVIHDNVDPGKYRQAWQYLVGQRRVRKAPTVGYDTPDFVASGANYFDEVHGFFGPPDRYNWKIKGKKEIYVPYNNNKQVTVSLDEAYTGHHFNPDVTRWELHRVWEVEANIKQGNRHAVPKRTFYIDEDTWHILLTDGYDAEGKLWRTTIVPTFVVPKVPATLVKPIIVFNLEANTSSTVQALNGEKFLIVPQKEEDFYTGDAVAFDSMR